jgi:hypothetical protein
MCRVQDACSQIVFALKRLRIGSGSCFVGFNLACHAIAEAVQEFKFPHGKSFASKRDDEIFAGELRLVPCEDLVFGLLSRSESGSEP